MDPLQPYVDDLPISLLGVDKSEDVQLFYYFVKSESNPKEDPLLLWLTGGPGCSAFDHGGEEVPIMEEKRFRSWRRRGSDHGGEEVPIMEEKREWFEKREREQSEKSRVWLCLDHSRVDHSSVIKSRWALFGPLNFKVKQNDGSLPTLLLNPNSWTKVASILFVDLPVGTGFSYGTTSLASKSTDLQSCDQAYEFLKKWLIDHSKFFSNPIYVGGDSYTGITIPIIVQLISNDLPKALAANLSCPPRMYQGSSSRTPIPKGQDLDTMGHPSCKLPKGRDDPTNGQFVVPQSGTLEVSPKVNSFDPPTIGYPSPMGFYQASSFHHRIQGKSDKDKC
ncbi:hypothetical protein TEA_016805 [Camellia sinensis var. sinensis]|uniref:Uncharacterized protein n=1 Tax=Camellia sinensis var. sinensis TaxID=542762 RepID=A0A4S4F116_CAMSN|nr:hypothetical protein TEA_016805 [Camellia sinensis var. sinensis]